MCACVYVCACDTLPGGQEGARPGHFCFAFLFFCLFICIHIFICMYIFVYVCICMYIGLTMENWLEQQEKSLKQFKLQDFFNVFGFCFFLLLSLSLSIVVVLFFLVLFFLFLSWSGEEEGHSWLGAASSKKEEGTDPFSPQSACWVSLLLLLLAACLLDLAWLGCHCFCHFAGLTWLGLAAIASATLLCLLHVWASTEGSPTGGTDHNSTAVQGALEGCSAATCGGNGCPCEGLHMCMHVSSCFFSSCFDDLFPLPFNQHKNLFYFFDVYCVQIYP